MHWRLLQLHTLRPTNVLLQYRGQQSTEPSMPIFILQRNSDTLLKPQRNPIHPRISKGFSTTTESSHVCTGAYKALPHPPHPPPASSPWNANLPPVMSLRLNAQMCARINITGAPIPKQYMPPAYINTQMHPNKNQVCFREARKMVRRHVHWLWDADGNTKRRYIFYSDWQATGAQGC